jgi:hypothetical protein
MKLMNVPARKIRILIAGILLLACMVVAYCDYKKGVLDRVTITYMIEYDEDPYQWYFTADEDSAVIE